MPKRFADSVVDLRPEAETDRVTAKEAEKENAEGGGGGGGEVAEEGEGNEEEETTTTR